MMKRCPLLFVTFFCLLLAGSAMAGNILFDASHREMSANADWVIDADVWDLYLEHYPCGVYGNESNPARIPTPAQSGITGTTAETYWTGGISSWGIELVKAGHTVETLPEGGLITYGDGTNLQDLSNYDLFIVPEPQTPFTAAEKSAILAFVQAGGGLFMVADHETSDRDCDGWDSPHIFNDLTGAVSAASAGLFGIWFRVDGIQNKGSEDWFDDGTDNNVETNPADPIINGPFGSGAGGIGFFGATSMDLNPADNPTATPHVWRTGQAHNNLRVTFATAEYGAGRVAAIGDSSPADDGTGDPGDSLYLGWDKASGGVNNREIHLNACDWLLNPTPDTTPPVITAGPAAAVTDCTAVITWQTDEPATSLVDYGTTASYGSQASTAGYTTSHSVTITGLTPAWTYHYQVSSTDASGNGPTTSSDATFTTASSTLPQITSGPTESGITNTSATILWTTNKPGDSTVLYGTSPALGQSANDPALVTSHSVTLTGLSPSTTYYYKVQTIDACGNLVESSVTSFTTTATPPQLDISGYTLYQYGASHSYTFPAATSIPADGYLIVARSASQATFEAEWGALPPGTVFLDSAGNVPQINGGESFELKDSTNVTVDGVTISMSADTAMQRNNPGDPPGSAGSWTSLPTASGNPGAGAGTPSGAGLVINEASDAVSFSNEFVELYYDAGTPDTTPPVITSGPTATPYDCTAEIAWQTDEPADSVVSYGLTSSLGSQVSDPTLVTSHLVTLSGLTPATSYYYKAASTDGSSNGPTESSITTFATTANAPVISGIYTDGITDVAAVVHWTTSETASRTVEYGTTTSYGQTAGSGTGTSHTVPLGSLIPATLYHYRVRSTDSCGLESISGDHTFTTLPPDTTPPSAVTDLAATPLDSTTIRLDWTAVGDDGTVGTAATYDIRQASRPIQSESNFQAATPLNGEPTPSVSGTPEQLLLAALSPDTPYFFAMKVADEVPNLSALSNSDGATTAPLGYSPGASHLVISALQVGGTNDDVIEIYNPTASPVSLLGYTIQYLAANGNFGFKDNLSGTVAAHGYHLIAASGYTGPPAADDSIGVHNMSGSKGHALLVQSTGNANCASGTIVDKVGYGAAASCPETSAAPVPPAGQSIVRKPGGTQGNGQDTDNNAADFLPPATPTWHNSSSPPASPLLLGNVGPSLFLSPGSPTPLDWANAVAATGYNLYRGTTPDFLAGSPPPWKTPGISETTDGATPASIYYYKVFATDGVNQSAD